MKRIKLRKERKKTINKIKSRLHEEEEKELSKELEELENCKDNTHRYHQVMRRLKRRKPKKSIIVHDKDGQAVASESGKVEEITKYFEQVFKQELDSLEEMPLNVPEKMDPPFTGEEIEKAVKKLKNNRSPGIDNINAELIKYGPKELTNLIAKVYNATAETGEYAEEIKIGVLNPIPKPKKKGPVANLRPVILLSMLRKILAICMINRTWHKMKPYISKDQAAYQEGRSTTEQVFTLKLLIEKAIISEKYDIFFMLLDMSKAFDTVKRTKLLAQLADILTNSELHIY